MADTVMQVLFIPASEALVRIIEQIYDIGCAADDVLIQKESFSKLNGYLQRIVPILKEITWKNIQNPESLNNMIEILEREIKVVKQLFLDCSKRNRFYLLVNCRKIVKRMEDTTKEICRALSLIPLLSLDLSTSIGEDINKLSDSMSKEEFKAAVAEEEVLQKIESGIRDRNADRSYANNLLLQIAEALGIPREGSAMKKELDGFKSEIEDAQLRKDQAEAVQMEQMIALLGRADAASSREERETKYYAKRNSLGNQPLEALQPFYCPITRELMEDPVETLSGQTFERSAIEKWFADGKNICPLTMIPLASTQLRPNITLRKSIEEWRDRNTMITIASMRPSLYSNDEDEVLQTLDKLKELCEERDVHREWVALEDYIPLLVGFLNGKRPLIKSRALAILCSLVKDNDDNKERIAAVDNAVEYIVRSLARRIEEGKLAVRLLLELSKNEMVLYKIGNVQGCIFLLVTMLNIDNAQASNDASEVLENLSVFDQNVVAMAKSNYFKPLLQQLCSDEWWMNFGIDDLENQNLAIRILSQTCSSSGCERNWSVFERIHTKRRNRLEHKRLNDLVYTHYNLRLKERQSSRKSLTDPISLENIDLTDDWVVEAEDDDAPLLDVDEIDDWMDVADAILDEGEGGHAAGPDGVKTIMAAALAEMELTDHSKSILFEGGALKPLLGLITDGDINSKKVAVKALQNLSTLPSNGVQMIVEGAGGLLIRLLHLPISAHLSLREQAAATIMNLAIASTSPEAGSMPLTLLESDDDISWLFSLINLTGPDIQRSVLRTFHALCQPRSAVNMRAKLKPCTSVLVLLCDVSNLMIRADAVKLLFSLTQDGDNGDLAEHVGKKCLETLLHIIQTSSNEEERVAAMGVLANLPTENNQFTEWLLEAEALPIIARSLTARNHSSSLQSQQLVENAAGALYRFTSHDNTERQKRAADTGVIPVLVRLLETGTALAKQRAAKSLAQFSNSSIRLSQRVERHWGFRCFSPPPELGCPVHGGLCSVESSFCLLEADGVAPLVYVLGEPDLGAREAALLALETLMENERLQSGSKIIAQANGVTPIIKLLSSESPELQEKALRVLERMFTLEELKRNYGASIQMPLVDITQRGNAVTKSLAARTLAHLNVLHDQSSYF